MKQALAKMEAFRCLKRYIAWEAYGLLPMERSRLETHGSFDMDTYFRGGDPRTLVGPEDVRAKLNALLTDGHALGIGNEADLILVLAAERALQFDDHSVVLTWRPQRLATARRGPAPRRSRGGPALTPRSARDETVTCAPGEEPVI